MSSIRARLRLVLEAVQPPGWVLLGVGVVLAVAGPVLGWGEFIAVAIAIGVVLLCAAGFTIGRQTYQVTLRMQRRQVVVGERALCDLVVTNTSARRLTPARIELPVGRRVASFALPGLGAQASHDEVFAVPTARRSVIRIGPARTVRGDPFGLMGRQVRWTEVLELYVHPRTVAIPGQTGGFVRDLEGFTTDVVTNSDLSFHALREYVPGDDRRHIHWRSSARQGELMVRQYTETRRAEVAIALDLDRSDYDLGDGPETAFELAVSVAGSLAVQALRDENTVSVLTSEGQLRATNPRRALDELCLVELSSGPRTGLLSGTRASSSGSRAGVPRAWSRGTRAASRGSLVTLARQVQHTVANASMVCLVTGAGDTVELARRTTTTFGADVRVLLVRVSSDPATELSVQTIGAASVITLGRLEDLPRAVRRASTAGIA